MSGMCQSSNSNQTLVISPGERKEIKENLMVPGTENPEI